MRSQWCLSAQFCGSSSGTLGACIGAPHGINLKLKEEILHVRNVNQDFLWNRNGTLWRYGVRLAMRFIVAVATAVAILIAIDAVMFGGRYWRSYSSVFGQVARHLY